MPREKTDSHSKPPSFLEWRQTEQVVEVRSLEFLAKNPPSQDLAVAITSAAQILFRHCARHPNDEPCKHTDDEHAILYLGTRVFNATQASWCLLLRGYYGPALTVQREVVESTLLLQRFALQPVEIGRWRASSTEERLRNYGPSKNRRLIDASGEPNLYWRFSQYSELAAHPTPRGRSLTTMDGRYWTGPHFNANLFGELLRHFALHVAFACDILCGFSFLENPDPKARARIRALFDSGAAEGTSSGNAPDEEPMPKLG
jgi:hypothetical protein